MASSSTDRSTASPATYRRVLPDSSDSCSRNRFVKDHAFYFKDGSHYCRVKNRLFSMFQTGEFSDISITVDGKKFQCHKNVLAANSPYFQAMFSCGLKEKTEKEIKIENIESRVFYDVMRYLYNGEVNITSDNAQSLLECSDMMQLEELKFGCSQYFEKYLSACNCFGIWNLAGQVNDDRLHKAAWDFSLAKFPDVIQEEEFSSLTVANLKLYLADANLNTPSEEKVCDAALKWLKSNMNHSEKDIEEIFKAIRFNNLDVVYVKTKLLQNPDIQKNSQIVHMLNGLLENLLYNFPLPYDTPILMPRLHTAMRAGVMIFGAYDKNSGGPPFIEDCTFVKHESRHKVCVHDTTSIPACYWEGVAACVVDGVVYVSGLGGPSFTNHNEVFKYEVSTDEWLACSNMNTGRIWHAMIRGYKDKIYILGGLPDDDERLGNGVTGVLQQVEEYLIERNIWETIGKLSLAVYTFGSVFHRGNIYTFGGYTNQQTKAKCKAIQSFDTTTNQCCILDWELPFPSYELIPVGLKNWAVLLGKDHSYVVDLEKLSKQRQTFPREDVREEESFIRTLPGIGYSDFGAELLGNQIFILGGVMGEGDTATVLKDIKVADIEGFINTDSGVNGCARKDSKTSVNNKQIQWKVAGKFEHPLGVYTTAVVKLYTERPSCVPSISEISI